MAEAVGHSAGVVVAFGKSIDLLTGLGSAEIGHCLLVRAVDFAAHSSSAVVCRAIQRHYQGRSIARMRRHLVGLLREGSHRRFLLDLPLKEAVIVVYRTGLEIAETVLLRVLSAAIVGPKVVAGQKAAVLHCCSSQRCWSGSAENADLRGLGSRFQN